VHGGDLHHPAVDAVLTVAARLVGMETVFVGGLTQDEFSFLRVQGDLPGVEEGATFPRADSFCDRLVAGAPPFTAAAADDPAYADVPARQTFGITSYVGVPVHGSDGTVIGTLCAVDRRSVAMDDEVYEVLRGLARVVEAHADVDARMVLRRTDTGWRVGTETEDDVTAAMVLADLVAGETATNQRPPRADDGAAEVDRLRVAVSQLEHALSARVVVEQAIGVLAERHHLTPRVAFERLRKAARSRGRKVHDLAREVVASSSDAGVPLPPELAGRR